IARSVVADFSLLSHARCDTLLASNPTGLVRLSRLPGPTRMPLARFALLASICWFAAATLRAETPVVEIVADPPQIRLTGPGSSYSLLVHGKAADGRLVDLTAYARFQSQAPAIAAATSAGVVVAKGDGATQIVVEAQGQKRTVAVEVKDFAK